MADIKVTTTPAPKTPNMFISWLKSTYKHLFLDVATGGLSFSKLWAELAGLLGMVIAFQGQLVALGISIPPQFMIYFKIAAIGSAILAAIRLRNSVSRNTVVE